MIQFNTASPYNNARGRIRKWKKEKVVMDKVYIFSGLGVDERVFDQINFDGLDVEFIDWIKPLKKKVYLNMQNVFLLN